MNGAKPSIQKEWDKVMSYKEHLGNNKYQRSDEVCNHMESLDSWTEDKAIEILEDE